MVYLNDIPTKKSKESRTTLYADDEAVFNKDSIENVGIKHDATFDAVANGFHKIK